MLLRVSLAKKETLYCPNCAGIVKLLLNLSVPPTKVRVNNCVLASGKVIFAVTLATPILSVTLAAISITSETLKLSLNVLLEKGVRSNTCGRVISNTVKLVFSVLLILLLVSFAIIVTLYTPGGSNKLRTIQRQLLRK